LVGTAKGSARAFTIDSLLKLTQTRSSSNKELSVLDFIADEVLRNSKITRCPFDFFLDIPDLEEAARTPLSEINSEFDQLILDLDMVRREWDKISEEKSSTAATIGDGIMGKREIIQKFHEIDIVKINKSLKKLSDFIDESSSKLSKLKLAIDHTKRYSEEMVQYFGARGSGVESGSILSYLHEFCVLAKDSIQRARKRIEAK